MRNFLFFGHNILYKAVQTNFHGGVMGEKVNILRASFAVAAGIILAQVISEASLSIIIPFAAAYVAARLARPLGVRISRACHVNEKAGCAVYAVIVCAFAVYILTYASGRLIGGLRELVGRLPEFAQDVAELLGSLYDMIPFLGDGEVTPIISGALKEAAAYAGNAAAELLGGIVQKLPGGMMSTLFGVVGFIYLTADLPGAGKSFRSLLPEMWAARLSRLFGDAESAAFSYFRAYLILMTVTFFELLTGLSIVGVPSPFAAAFIIAIIDALPVLGCGTVLVPWAALSFYQGEIWRGAGLLIVFGVIYIVRQFLEPRLIGKMTGVHPFVALFFIFCGWRLAGVLGLILAPVLLLLLTGREKNFA